jgi:hypothetical protein
MKTVTSYQVIDHGFDSEQYFQGCGTAFTEFDDCATGCGETAREAFEDACESLAQNDWDTSKIKGKSNLSRQSVQGYLKSIGINKEDRDDTETHAYVSIRVK